MVVLAWLSGFALLVFVFSDLLEKRDNPNASPESLTISGKTEVRLKRNRAGHYVTSGYINSVPVTFLIDTGATDVAIPSKLAPVLGLKAGAIMRANTANGIVNVAQTYLDSVSIGDITLNNIRANINPGMGGEQILLGMSVLKQLEFTQRGDTLILRTL